MTGTADGAVPPNPFAGGERFSKDVMFDVESIRAFATLAGDFNPLHHDDDAARAGPFGVLIASGTQVTSLLMGLNATLLSDYGMALGLGFDFRFDKAIPAGAMLTLAWTITGCTYKPSLKGYVVSLEGEARDAAGTLYLTARGSNLLRPFARAAA